MGVEDLIVDNGEDYIALTLRLASDADFKEEMRKKI